MEKLKEQLKEFGHAYLVRSYAIEVLNLEYRTDERNKALNDDAVNSSKFLEVLSKLHAQQERNNAFEQEIIRRMK